MGLKAKLITRLREEEEELKSDQNGIESKCYRKSMCSDWIKKLR
ncbi:MAG: hypothetical protein QXU31_05520 [Archaeoglobaceae archaeon]